MTYLMHCKWLFCRCGIAEGLPMPCRWFIYVDVLDDVGSNLFVTLLPYVGNLTIDVLTMLVNSTSIVIFCRRRLIYASRVSFTTRLSRHPCQRHFLCQHSLSRCNPDFCRCITALADPVLLVVLKSSNKQILDM